MKFEWDTLEDLDRWILDSSSWASLDDQQFREFAAIGLLLLGKVDKDKQQELLPLIFPLYVQAVRRLTKGQRLSIYDSLIHELDADNFSVPGLLPVVVCEPDLALASTATVDLLAYSPLGEAGLPDGLLELIPLLSERVPENMGAVLGGLVSFGDSRLRISMDTAKIHLTSEEVQLAARCTTGFPTHAAIEFWLEWAKELALDGSVEALGKLGSAASAILLQKRNARVEVVRDVRRNYPVQRSEKPMELVREWTFAKYAALIAPRLYALEAAEAPPKIFSSVLEEWGLAPKALEKDRFNG